MAKRAQFFKNLKEAAISKESAKTNKDNGIRSLNFYGKAGCSGSTRRAFAPKTNLPPCPALQRNRRGGCAKENAISTPLSPDPNMIAESPCASLLDEDVTVYSKFCENLEIRGLQTSSQLRSLVNYTSQHHGESSCAEDQFQEKAGSGSVGVPNFETGCNGAQTKAQIGQSSQDSERESSVSATKLLSDESPPQHSASGSTVSDENNADEDSEIATGNKPSRSCDFTLGSEQVPNFEVEEDSGIGSATVNESSRSPDDNLEPGQVNQVKRNLFPEKLPSDSSLDDLIPIESSSDFQDLFSGLPDGIHDISVIIPVSEVSDLIETLNQPEARGRTNQPSQNMEESFEILVPSSNSFDESLSSDPGPHTSGSHSRKYTPLEKLTRKRQSNPEKWRRNIIKEKVSRGEEYVNTSGNLVRARKVQPPCDKSCRLECYNKISEAERQEIHDGFYKKHPTREEKWGFISRHVTLFEKKSNIDNETRRKFSRKYHFKVGTTDIQVCKVMFLTTLDINDGMVETVCSKLRNGGNISPDKRGKHLHTPRALNPCIKESVRDHINAIPRMPGHYTRANSNKEFLTAEIQTQKEMHEIYLDWMKEIHPNQKVATYRQYCDVFSNEFNISFFISKKDRCDDCEMYNNSTAEQKLEMQADYEEHILNKDLAQAMYNADRIVSRQKTSKHLVVASFDFEKTLICPKANTSVFYYKRKLTISNFTIVDEGIHEDNCYVYDEAVAGKGPNEVGSFLLHFISRKVEAGAKEFRFYSDNCFAQNKNRGLTAALLHAAAKFGISICHRYLEKGHTYNAADTVHSLIERKAKPVHIYTPGQWYEVIGTAKRSVNNPIKVVQVDKTMIFDWKNLASKLNLDKDVKGKPIPWQKLRELSYDGNTPYEVKFKLNLDELTPTTVDVKTVGRPVNIKEFKPNQDREGPRPITQKKYKDLMHYCDKNFIPPEHQDFYRKLVPSDSVQSDGEDEAAPKPGRAKKMKPKSKSRGRKRKAGTSEKSPDPADDEIEEFTPPTRKRRARPSSETQGTKRKTGTTNQKRTQRK